MALPKLYDIFFRHNLSTGRKGEGSLLLSEFEGPRTILIKQQQQQQYHIFFMDVLELFSILSSPPPPTQQLEDVHAPFVF